MTPDTVVSRFGAEGASAILRTDIDEAVMPAMRAAIRGGFRVVEITLTTPNACDHIATLAEDPDLLVGAGTVLTVEDVRRACDAGARLIVSPVVDEDVIEEAARLGAAAMPGCHTPTELLRAHRAGAPLQKLFPAPGLGPAYVKACLGPLPFLRIVPTNGVDASNAGAWMAAGAYALGFVAPLFSHDDLVAGRFDAVEAKARRLIAASRPPR